MGGGRRRDERGDDRGGEDQREVEPQRGLAEIRVAGLSARLGVRTR